MGRKLFTAALALLLLTAAAPKDDSFTKRRTLYVTLGEDTVRFEAPTGMCFADRTRRSEAAFVESIHRLFAKKGDEKLLGIFMPCDSLANPGSPMAREGRVPSIGLITWPQKIEAVADMRSSASYLAYRAPSFREYVAVNLPAILAAADPLRDFGDNVRDPVIDGGVMQDGNLLMSTYSQYISADGQPVETVGAMGTLWLRGHAVELTVRLNPVGGVETGM